MEDNQNNVPMNQNQERYVMCRASDILKLMRTKEDRNNIAKENSKINLIFINYRLDDSKFARLRFKFFTSGDGWG